MSDLPADDPGSIEEIVAGLYDELRTLARLHLRREQAGHTLNTTALVHEAYIRLAGQDGLHGADRTRFFAAASNTMRRVLVDHARRRNRAKRGGGGIPVPLEEVEAFLSDREASELIALDEALHRLEAVDPRGAEIVQYRYFGGLSQEETAEILGVSGKTVQRAWTTARAWLRKEVAESLAPPNGHRDAIPTPPCPPAPPDGAMER